MATSLGLQGRQLPDPQRAQLSRTVAEQGSTIRSLETRLGARLKDELVPFKEEVRRHEAAVAALALDLRETQQREASFLKSKRQLERASIEQTQTIAGLKEEIASLHLLLEERAREARHVQEQAVVEAKRHARAERRWAEPSKQIAALSAQAKAAAAAAAAEMEEVAAAAAAEMEEAAAMAAGAEAQLLQLTAKCEARVAEAAADVKRAQGDAVRAREEAVAEAQLAREAEAAEAAAAHAHEMKLLERRLKRAEQRATKVVAEEYRPTERSPEEWAALSYEAERSASRRERQVLRSFLDSRAWRTEDLAAVLHEGETLACLFDTKEGTGEYMVRVQKLLKELERLHFGNEFALFLHFELNLTLDKVHRIMQAASKRYNFTTHRYSAKVLFYNKYHGRHFIKVPRIAPPRYKLEPVLKRIYNALGTDIAADGRVAFTSFNVVMQEMYSRDVGLQGMPRAGAFGKGRLKLPIVISWDATGFGRKQFNTVAARNPYLSRSAQLLRVFGLGNCDDGREGTKLVLGPNLPLLNAAIVADQKAECIKCGESEIWPEMFVVTDISALRHCEHLANSGWCKCEREHALRDTAVVEKKPETVEALKALLKECESPTAEERYIMSHNTLPGESQPRPCPCCSFGHEPSTVLAKQKAMYEDEARLAAEKTKAGKARFSRWRMEHAHKHGNVQPGLYGEPLLRHDLDKQLLDPLHLAELGIPKTSWKHGVLNHASDDAREQISEQLKAWKHPLDCRRKEDNRCRADKWFTGEAWASFCAGTGGRPGGPRAIAGLMKIVADDLQLRGVASGMTVHTATQPTLQGVAVPARGRGRGRGRAAFVANAGRGGSMAVPVAQLQEESSEELTRAPTALERAADHEDLEVVRELFGSRANTIINTLLAFDGYFAWYYPLKLSVPFRCEMALREQRALDNIPAVQSTCTRSSSVSPRATTSPSCSTAPSTRCRAIFSWWEMCGLPTSRLWS